MRPLCVCVSLGFHYRLDDVVLILNYVKWMAYISNQIDGAESWGPMRWRGPLLRTMPATLVGVWFGGVGAAGNQRSTRVVRVMVGQHVLLHNTQPRANTHTHTAVPQSPCRQTNPGSHHPVSSIYEHYGAEQHISWLGFVYMWMWKWMRARMCWLPVPYIHSFCLSSHRICDTGWSKDRALLGRTNFWNYIHGNRIDDARWYRAGMIRVQDLGSTCFLLYRHCINSPGRRSSSEIYGDL